MDAPRGLRENQTTLFRSRPPPARGIPVRCRILAVCWTRTQAMDLAQIAGPQTWRRGGITAKDWLVPVPEAATGELDAAVERLRRDPRPAESLALADFELPACGELMTNV